jgi:ATP-dependent Clp protease ATP-binding subunit ClpC
VGQDEAIKSITQAIRRSRIGISDPKRPIGSFIFLGPTGVGKTELVKVLAREIFGDDDALVKIDMSEFMEKHNVSRLVGAPAGYVGYEEGGKLTEVVRRKPYSVILLDEIEKAHPEVFNILLQILEDGELTDAKGRRVDFRNTLIVMTSNLGTNLLTSQAKIGFNVSANKKEEFDNQYEKMKENVLSNVEKHFRPEFINRLDQIIVFKPLSREVIRTIVNIELNKLLSRIKSQNIRIEITAKAKDKIAKLGYKPEYGARPMRKVIIENIENPLTEGIMLEEFNEGDKVKIDLVKDKIVLKKE